MYSKYLTKIKALPNRTADWANRNGPVALWGLDNLGNGSADRLHKVFQETSLTTDTDTYCRVKWFEEGPIEAPPLNVPHLPLLNLGVMENEDKVGSGEAKNSSSEGNTLSTPGKEWYTAAATVAGTIAERGYVPVTIGGDPDITLPVFEGIKTVLREDIVMVCLGADGRLSTTNPAGESSARVGANKVLLDKNMLRGMLHLGGRRVGREERRLRKEHSIKYVESNALFAKGINNMKDFKNTYPLYISIDLSVLDPSVAPGVEHPEPGGLSVRDVLHILNTLRGTKVVGIDIVGYRPEYEVKLGQQLFGLTELAASKVIKESLGKAYFTSTMTAAEASEKMVKMKKDGMIHPEYPEF